MERITAPAQRQRDPVFAVGGVDALQRVGDRMGHLVGGEVAAEIHVELEVEVHAENDWVRIPIDFPSWTIIGFQHAPADSNFESRFAAWWAHHALCT